MKVSTIMRQPPAFGQPSLRRDDYAMALGEQARHTRPNKIAQVTFVPYEHPVRVAFVGLGRIYDLNVRGYVGNPDVEVVALVDPSPERRAQRQADWPAARTFASAAELASSGIEVDAVEALLPVGLHADGLVELLGFGWHVNLQKPICGELPDAQRMLDAAKASGRILRVMENYLFYEPLRKLKATIDSGQIGDVAGYHLKMVGSGNGGWDVPWSSFELQMDQMKRGRGIFVFDDGWHKLSTAIWLFGPVREVRAWIGNTAVGPGIDLDAPTTIIWEHDNGVRGVWDITLAMDMYLRSDYYTNDERWEITGSRGYARVNRCTGRGIQQPSLEVYADGEMRGYHALDDDWASSFRDSGRHWLRWLRTGEGPLLWSGEEAADVLRFALAAYASSASGGLGVNPRQVGLSSRSRSRVAWPADVGSGIRRLPYWPHAGEHPLRDGAGRDRAAGHRPRSGHQGARRRHRRGQTADSRDRRCPDHLCLPELRRRLFLRPGRDGAVHVPGGGDRHADLDQDAPAALSRLGGDARPAARGRGREPV